MKLLKQLKGQILDLDKPYHKTALELAAMNGWGLKRETVTIEECINNEQIIPTTPKIHTTTNKRRREPSPPKTNFKLENYQAAKRKRQKLENRLKKEEEERKHLRNRVRI